MKKYALQYVELELETSYLGSGDGTVLVPQLQEQINTEPFVNQSLEDTSIISSVFQSGEAPRKGLQEGSFGLSMDLAALETNTGGAITIDELGKVLRDSVGASVCGTGSTINDVTPSTTEYDATSASGISIGDLILVQGEARFVSNKVTETLTVTPAHSVAPTNGATIYAGQTLTPDDTRATYKVTIHNDLTNGFLVEGVHMVPSFEGLSAGEGKAKIKLACSFGKWTDETSDLATISPVNCGDIPAVVQSEGKFVLTDGTTTINANVSAFALGTLLTEVRPQDVTKPNCIGAPAVVPGKPEITVELWETVDERETLRTWFNARTDLELVYQIGDSAADCVAFYFGKVFLKGEPAITDKGGLVSLKCTLQVSAEPGEAHFVMARF